MNVSINGIVIDLQFDSGSDLTIISEKNWLKLNSPKLSAVNFVVRDAQEKCMEFLGQFDCRVELFGTIKTAKCFVSPKDCNLFGISWITLFELWSRPINAFCKIVHHNFNRQNAINLIEKNYDDLFSDSLGLCNSFTAKLQLKTNASPVFIPKRPVPYHIMPEVDEELQRLETLGVITPTSHSEWAAPIVVVRKANNKIRICGDYSTGLNSMLDTNRYPIPTLEELYNRLVSGRVFATIDLSDAYLQIGVCEESKKMLTIHTHRGLYQFLRMPPGISSAPALFQRLVDQLIAGLDNVVGYFDDLCIAGRDEEHLFQTIETVLNRLRDNGFHIRREKCKFFAEEIKFLGNIINKDGLKADPDKIAAIVDLPPPTDIKSLRSFLGAINFYGKFIKNMSHLSAPLNHLLKNGVKWNWSKQCQQSFEKFKEILLSDLVLTHYQQDLPIQVAADASSYAIGAQLSHEFDDGSIKAIAYASRTLTKTERSYSQIEREALALIFAVKHFHRYIFGKKFTLVTDHKPLLAIFGSKKGIAVHAANRIQRWQLILHAYQFDIKYTSTTDFGYVDVLSRLIKDRPPEDEYIIACTKFEEQSISELDDSIRRFPITHQQIVNAMAHSEEMALLKYYIANGWPTSPELIPYREVASFYKVKDLLSELNSCLLYRNRLIVPFVYRNQILKRLHEAHPGQERMVSLARSYVYWPGIDAQIRQFVKECDNCQRAGKTPIRSVLYSWPEATRPWQRIHIDYASRNGENFLVVVDSYSKWPEIVQTTSTTTEKTIEILQNLCTTWGLPETLISDNGTQFTSAMFQEFCQESGIEHIRSSPHFPMSNGQAERFVQTLKQSLEKMTDESPTSTKLRKMLFAYRMTPHASTPGGVSPAEKFIGRKLNSTLSLLFKKEREEIPSRNEQMEKQYNQKHGAKHRTFNEGDKVYARYFQNNRFIWVLGLILNRIGNVNYDVCIEFQSGRQRRIRSHANQLKPRATNDENTDQPQQQDKVLPLPLLDDEEVEREQETTDTRPNTPFRSRRRLPTRSTPPVLRPRGQRQA